MVGGSYFGDTCQSGWSESIGDVQHEANDAGKVDRVSELASTSIGPERLREGKKNGTYQQLRFVHKIPMDPCPSGTCSKISKSPSHVTQILYKLLPLCWILE